jgi:hopanoid biosynthesis associated protein HpnK
MAGVKPRRLIVNADDFGLSESVNRAVIEAHQRGILTSASLMVAGDACDQAVRLARANPTLAIGLHLTLCCGRSVSPHAEIPSLVNAQQRFSLSPVWAGLKYFFSPRARDQLRCEVSAQLAKFAQTGLPLDHINGHLHFHMHPAAVDTFESRAARLTNDPISIDWPLGRGRFCYRLSHAIIFSLLARRTRPRYRDRNIACTDHVFGLLESGGIDESYVLALLANLPPGNSELYSHPSLQDSRHEFEALISPRVREAIEREQIELIRYQDLWSNS